LHSAAAGCAVHHGRRGLRVGSLSQVLYDQAQKQGWTVINMKRDWKKIFSFEQ
jgi:hypothetical protein